MTDDLAQHQHLSSVSMSRQMSLLLRCLLVPGYIVTFVALSWLVHQFETLHTVSLWYPPAGLQLAFLIVLGPRWAGVVFLAIIANNAFGGTSGGEVHWPLWIVNALIGAAGYSLAAATIRTFSQGRLHLTRTANVVVFLLASAVWVGPVAILSVEALVQAGVMPREDWLTVVRQWWIGDMIGILSLTPLLLVVLGSLGRTKSSGLLKLDPPMGLALRQARVGEITEVVVWGMVTVGLIAYVFSPNLADRDYPVYLCFLPMLWFAIRHGLPGAALAVFVVNLAILALQQVIHQTLTTADQQMVMLAIAATTLIVGGVMTDRRRDANELAQSENRYRTFIEQASDGMVFTDTQGRILELNPAACELAGYAHEQVIGRPLTDLLTAGDPSQHARYWQRLLDGETLVIEATLRHRGGHGIDVEASGKLITDGRVQAIIRDIRERKQNEQRERLLRSELDHRVKNNLAAVLSLADETLNSSDSIESFRAAFGGRLRAMGRTHELLAKARWTNVDLQAAIVRILAPFGSDDGARLGLTGDHVTLPSRAVMPLTLAFFELGTNAAKYGAWSNGQGRVEVSWRVIDERLFIEWREQGGPTAKEPTRPGTGMNLIDGLVGYQLMGSVHFEFPPTGLVASLELPMSLHDPISDSKGVLNVQPSPATDDS